MNKEYKYYPAVILILSSVLFCCSPQRRELCGSWESVLIENRSPFFAKILPSSVKGEIILTFDENNRFTWINKKEKLYLSGKYRMEKNKIYFDIGKETIPVKMEFNFQNNKLLIITDDGFLFTFLKN